MSDDLTDFLARRGPVAGRPLMGLTVLAVEDSRFACEALRLLCLRSGARIRRADCLRSARRHLETYLPSVAIVDLGLPDGSGIELIRDLSGVPAVLATSGDPSLRGQALAAGARGFLEKPIENIAAFQSAVLAALPRGLAQGGRAGSPGDRIEPDQIALRDDLAHAAALLERAPDSVGLGYIAQFLSGLAVSAHDQALQEAAGALARDHGSGVGIVSGLLRDRLASGAAF